jgi:hypothetical protein
MAGALVVIPLAAMVFPIVLILVAVLVDILFLGWMVFQMWHDEWAARVGEYVRAHLVRPIRNLAHSHQRIA